MITNTHNLTALAGKIATGASGVRRTLAQTQAKAPAQTASLNPGNPAGAQYDFAAIFGAASDARTPNSTSTPDPSSVTAGLTSPIAMAKTAIASSAVQFGHPTTKSAMPAAITASPTAAAPASTATTTTSTPTAAVTTPAAVSTPGIQALVSAIMGGTFQPTNVTDPSKLQETNPAGTATMPNFYYASDQTAAQLAQLLGGTVVQMKPFGQDIGWNEPSANFIQLQNGQTFNAADVAYYARVGAEGPAQLTADITQTINEGSAWTNYYQHGGQMPIFAMGYVGPAITGMTYPSNMLAANGTVINPAMQNIAT